MFVIFREGIYRHECGGVFSTREKAEEAARAMIAQEEDDYHEWHVVPFILDQSVPFSELDKEYHWPRVHPIEQKPVAIFHRVGQEVMRQTVRGYWDTFAKRWVEESTC